MSDVRTIEALLKKYDSEAPRYTSYPPIPYWREITPDDVAGWLGASSPHGDGSLSLYTHVPFCHTRCSYCGCFVIITSKEPPVSKYVASLHREMELVRRHLGSRRRVRQYHLGGGTPTHINQDEIARLTAKARHLFEFEDDVEMSIELDPRRLSVADLAHMRGLGFNRLSFGIQDFDPEVQREVNRIQPHENVAKLVDAARAQGYLSLNFDLIYGLPRQTRARFEGTVDKVIAMRPDRLAIYNFAFLPNTFPHQRRMDAGTLPPPDEKMAIFLMTQQKLMDAGYAPIGLDHFALENDELAVAARNGTMHRNFMGYTTQAGADLIGFGVSGISEYNGCFWQNEKKLVSYERIVDTDTLPVVRGMLLDPEDLLRKQVISGLFCEGGVDFARLGARFGGDMAGHFAQERRTLQPLAEDGLIRLAPDKLEILPLGRHFLRNIAVVFDNHIDRTQTQVKFSRTV